MGGGAALVLIKRSFTLAGHRTSVALEPEFWSALDALAAQDGHSTMRLVREVDEARTPEQPLTSALRVHCLLVRPR